MSQIAQQLKEHKIDIIDAFKMLYRKYIDPINAPFMINIASNTRQVLTRSFDNKDYADTNNENNDNGNISMIDVEWNKMQQENTSIDCINWLLETVITQMDATVKEIAPLLLASFARYKKKHRDLQSQLQCPSMSV